MACQRQKNGRSLIRQLANLPPCQARPALFSLPLALAALLVSALTLSAANIASSYSLLPQEKGSTSIPFRSMSAAKPCAGTGIVKK